MGIAIEVFSGFDLSQYGNFYSYSNFSKSATFTFKILFLMFCFISRCYLRPILYLCIKMSIIIVVYNHN